jgi:hypothetical protein
VAGVRPVCTTVFVASGVDVSPACAACVPLTAASTVASISGTEIPLHAANSKAVSAIGKTTRFMPCTSFSRSRPFETKEPTTHLLVAWSVVGRSSCTPSSSHKQHDDNEAAMML